MDVLVTGGAGFIGSNLVGSLVSSGARVRVLDDLSTGSLENLAGLGGDIDFVEADVRSRAAVARAVAGAEVVYHLAALPSVARSIADPLTTNAVNVDGTLNVLVESVAAGVRRVVFASSSSIYGDVAELPKHEDMLPASRSPYAVSKLAGEAYCRAFARSYPIETVALRFFNVFGPRQDPASEYAAVIPRFITRILAGLPPEIFGDGTQSRDFTYIGNAVQACRLAAEAGPAAVGETVNVGCNQRISLLELLARIERLLGRRVEPVFGPPRPGDVRDSQASIEKARRLLGYRPETTMADGLAETVSWFVARSSANPSVQGRRSAEREGAGGL